MDTTQNQARTWRNQFPETFAVPDEIDRLVKFGLLEDTSWGNDIAPSFEFTATREARRQNAAFTARATSHRVIAFGLTLRKLNSASLTKVNAFHCSFVTRMNASAPTTPYSSTLMTSTKWSRRSRCASFKRLRGVLTMDRGSARFVAANPTTSTLTRLTTLISVTTVAVSGL